METIWKTQPSMLLARQAIILHLQHNAKFTVVTSIDHFWGEQWKEYVQDKMPAFMLLTDAENIPWKTKTRKKADSAIEFFFRSLLMHCLGHGLNCVFISGIEMTATKVMGFYMESLPKHKASMRRVSVSIIDLFQIQVLLPPSSYSSRSFFLFTGQCEVYHWRIFSGFIVFRAIRFLGVYSAMQCNVMQCSAVQYSAIECNTGLM